MRVKRFLLIGFVMVFISSVFALGFCEAQGEEAEASAEPVLFLTSHPGGIEISDEEGEGCYVEAYDAWLISTELESHLAEDLKIDLPGPFAALLFPSDPEWTDYNEAMLRLIPEAFRASGLDCGDCVLFDGSDMSVLNHLGDFELIVLLGGHVPTQNAFFQEIGLKEKIAGYTGVILGISSGSMNMAYEVYAPPEEEGEMDDPDYDRFLDGLGLTDVQVLPHMEDMLIEIVDGKSTIDYAALPDSDGHLFFGLYDGDYIVIRNGDPTLVAESDIWFGGGARYDISLEESAQENDAGSP